MSWEERDYTWFGASEGWRSDWRHFLPPPATLGLVVAHLCGWIFVTALHYGVSEEAAGAYQLDHRLIPWAILTHPISTTSGLLSSLGIICLWSLAARVEEQLGRPRMLALYFGGNTLAAMAYVAIAGFSPKHGVAPLNLPVGALAAWSIAIWRNLPFESLAFFGRFFPMKSVTAVVAIAAAVICAGSYREGAMAWLAAAVCGGGVAPVIEMIAKQWARRREPRPVGVTASASARRSAKSTTRAESTPRKTAPPHVPEDVELDSLLAKISKGGLSSLTDDERSRLEAARQARLRREQRE